MDVNLEGRITVLVQEELSERIRADYLKQHPMPEEDAPERIRISEQAQAVADEIVKTELIYV